MNVSTLMRKSPLLAPVGIVCSFCKMVTKWRGKLVKNMKRLSHEQVQQGSEIREIFPFYIIIVFTYVALSCLPCLRLILIYHIHRCLHNLNWVLGPCVDNAIHFPYLAPLQMYIYYSSVGVRCRCFWYQTEGGSTP